MKLRRIIQILGRLSLLSLVASAPLHAGHLDDQLVIEDGHAFDDRRQINDYDESLSKFDGSADTRNPYIGTLHRTFDSGFSPERDHSLFVKRIREGVSLYKNRGMTTFSNPYNLFRTVADYLPGGSLGYDGGQPVVAMFTRSKQVFLIYRVYETKDGRSTLLCYYNSDGKIGNGGRGFAERLFTLKGFKLSKGYRFTEDGATGSSIQFGLIDPAEKLSAEDGYDAMLAGTNRAQRQMNAVESAMDPDSDWEMNPPHPDNIKYTSGQVEKKVEGKTDILQSILDPLMFGAKLGVGAYMLKEVFKKNDKDDDDDDYGNGWDYGNGMDYGMGGYGNGSIMGGGMYPGMYPGMMPGMMPGGMYPGMMPGGMYPGMGMPPMAPPMTGYPNQFPPMQPPGYPYQQPGFPGSYPGSMPGGSYPGAGPMPGPDYSQPIPGDYPGAGPIGGGYMPPGGGYQPPGSGYLPPGGGYQPPGGGVIDPLGPYVPVGADPNMIPVPGNTAPLAPSSSGSNSYGTQIYHNDNTFLSTSGL